MTKDEALKLALEALELSAVTVDSFGVQSKTQAAITAIKQALAQPVKPVAGFESLCETIRAIDANRQSISSAALESGKEHD